MICKVCHREFTPKRTTQEYCNGICRRRMELYRKRWDMHLAYIENAERNAADPNVPKYWREHYAEYAKKQRAELTKRP